MSVGPYYKSRFDIVYRRTADNMAEALHLGRNWGWSETSPWAEYKYSELLRVSGLWARLRGYDL